MEKYLINWNENKADAEKRNYDFSKDFFDFFRAINTCMLSDFNAWVHYAAKRYYALLGDGTTGAGSSGSITKRGYIMAHFAKFVTGMTRIDIDFGATPLEGSAFLSQTGDTVVAVVANATDEEAPVTLDLPFYTQKGELLSTTKTKSMTATTLSGDYVEDDSYVQEFTTDALCTSLDMSACSSCPSSFPWLQGTNRVVWMPDDTNVSGANLIVGDQCRQLELSTNGSAFRPVRSFQADKITLTTTVNGCRLLMLPFNAVIPEGAKAYTIGDDLALTQMRSIPAHTPVLIEGLGEMNFTGQGEVGNFTSPLIDTFRGTCTPMPLYAGDYVLDYQDGQWGFRRLDAPTTLGVFGVYASLNSQAAFVPIASDVLGITTITSEGTMPAKVFDLQGRQLSTQPLKPGIYIKNGKKFIVR